MSYKHFSQPLEKLPRIGKLKNIPLIIRRHKDKVECLECGKELLSLPTHLNFIHKISTKEYKLKYPNTPIMGNDLHQFYKKQAPIISKKGKKARKLFWSKPLHREEKRKLAVERLKDPIFKEKFRLAGQKATKVRKHNEFLSNKAKHKQCPICKKEFYSKLIKKGKYTKVADSGKRWKRKVMCSRECLYKSFKGRKFSKKTRMKLSIALKKYHGRRKHE